MVDDKNFESTRVPLTVAQERRFVLCQRLVAIVQFMLRFSTAARSSSARKVATATTVRKDSSPSCAAACKPRMAWHGSSVPYESWT